MIGKIIKNEYRIEEKIGSGGMADVYKATKLSTNEIVALKVLPDKLARDNEMVQRFHREIRLTSALKHPNIVQIIEDGEEYGIHYFAMEYVDGDDLSEIMRREGALSQQQAIGITTQVCNALEYAHGKGIIHRDIKPENILLTKDGRVKITDFGIAKAADGTHLTKTGTAFGSPEYMSPEQCQGDPKLDYRSDIYSVGVVLYQMLTGEAPFTGTIATIVHHHIYEPPTPPRQKNPAVPEWLDRVILKSLEKSPQLRYQSAAEMRRAISPDIQVDEEEVVQEPVTPPIEETRKLPGRFPLWAIALQMFSLILIAGICLLIWQHLITQRERKIAALLSAGKQYYKDEAYEECIDKMNSVLKLKPSHEEAKNYIGQAEKQLRIEGHFTTGMSVFNIGLYSKCIQEMEEVLKEDPNHLIAKKQKEYAEKLIQIQSEESGKRTSEEWFNMGYEHQDKPHEAIIYYQKALDVEEYSATHSNIGSIYASLGRRAEAVDEHQKAIKLDAENIYARIGLGNVYLDQGRYHDAIEQYEKAKEIDNENISAHIALGNGYAFCYGQLTKAMDAYRKAEEIDSKNPYLYFVRGNVYFEFDRYDDAIKEYQKAIKLDPKFVDAYLNLGAIYHQKEKYDAAIKEYETILETAPDNLEAHRRLGNVYNEQEKYDQALSEYKKAYELNPMDASSLNTLAYFYAEQGTTLRKAERLLKQAIEMLPSAHKYFLDSLGWVYYKLGRYQEAHERVKESINLMLPYEKRILSESYYHLGMIQEKLDLTNLAKKSLNEAIQFKPNSKIAKRAQSALENL
jgi:serine/threonine protein kinase/Tfp pilus assembly protein PilF